MDKEAKNRKRDGKCSLVEESLWCFLLIELGKLGAQVAKDPQPTACWPTGANSFTNLLPLFIQFFNWCSSTRVGIVQNREHGHNLDKEPKNGKADDKYFLAEESLVFLCGNSR